MFKLSHCKNGFTLFEAMVALLVLVVCLTWLGPIFGRVSSERQSIVQNETALTILNNQLTSWSAGSSSLPAEIHENDVDYQLNWNLEGPQMVELCVTWTNQAERNQVVCGKAKR